MSGEDAEWGRTGRSGVSWRGVGWSGLSTGGDRINGMERG